MPKGGYVPFFELRTAGVGAEIDAPVSAPGDRTRRNAAMIAGIVVLTVAVAGLYWFRAARPSPKLAVAVLPFSNAGADPATEYYADGLTEELIDSIGRTGGLRLVARSSVFQYKGRDLDPKEIGRRLKADILVEGSFRKQGQRIRVSTQLIDVNTGYETWSETLERDWSQMPSLQQEVSRAIAERLRVRPAINRAHGYTTNVEAYDLYLQGRFQWNRRTQSSIRAAIASFRGAIDKDPNYALAWAGLADAYSVLGFMEGVPAETHRSADEAAEHAVRLDDALAEAHSAQGTVQALYDWDWPGAERSFRRALELDQNSSLAHYGLSKVLASEGRFDPGIAEAKRALELDPLSMIIASSLGWELAAARRYPEADAAFQAALDQDPVFSWTYLFRAWSREVRGDFDGAIADLRKAVDLGESGGMAAGDLAYSLARAKRTQEASALLQQLQREAKTRFVSGFVLSRAYDGLGRREEAMRALIQAADERSPMIVFIKAEPLFDPLRNDARFQSLVRLNPE